MEGRGLYSGLGPVMENRKSSASSYLGVPMMGPDRAQKK